MREVSNILRNLRKDYDLQHKRYQDNLAHLNQLKKDCTKAEREEK